MTSTMMDVVVCAAPGLLQLERRPVPELNKGEVLIRVRRVGVCGTDLHIFKGTQPYLTYPRVMGHEFSGEVVMAPQGSRFGAGDPVYVTPYMSCQRCNTCRNGKPNCCKNLEVLGVHRDGAMAQYVCVPERFVFNAIGISLDQAAMVEFLAIGAHAVRRGDVRPKQRVLVVGAGPIGIACALFSMLRQASLTIVDTSAVRLEFCRRHLGVQHALIVDSDTNALLAEATAGEMFDVTFDATGNPAAMESGFRFVAHGGTYVLVSVVNAEIKFSDPEFHRREMTLVGSRNATPEDFELVVWSMRTAQIPTDALRTHRTNLRDVPAHLPQWLTPESGVIKAIVEC